MIPYRCLKSSIFGPKTFFSTGIRAGLHTFSQTHGVHRSDSVMYPWGAAQITLNFPQRVRSGFITFRSVSKASRKRSDTEDGEQLKPPPNQNTSHNLRAVRPSIQTKPSYAPPQRTPEPDVKQDAHQKLTYTIHLHRNTQVIWSVIAVFILVYVLGLLLRRESAERESKPDFQTSTEDPQSKRGAVSVASGTPRFPAFSKQSLAYQVGSWPPKDLSPTSWMPFVTSMFAHGNAIHLGINCYGFYQLSHFLMVTPLGITGTLGTWFFGGIFASVGSCIIQKAYTEGRLPLESLLKKDPVDPNPTRTLNTRHLGASGGLMAMLGIVSTWRYHSTWGLPLVPLSAPAWCWGLAAVAWDLWGFHNNSPDGIGHDAHLAGMAAGVLMWLLMLRRGKYGKPWEMIFKQ